MSSLLMSVFLKMGGKFAKFSLRCSGTSISHCAEPNKFPSLMRCSKPSSRSGTMYGNISLRCCLTKGSVSPTFLQFYILFHECSFSAFRPFLEVYYRALLHCRSEMDASPVRHSNGSSNPLLQRLYCSYYKKTVSTEAINFFRVPVVILLSILHSGRRR